MALNPFFLQGSVNEQRLIQELINEQLKIYGVEVTYIPRKFVRKETIIREVTSSKFDDNFALEAYVANYEGYSGSGDILTKFGMSLKDELTLIISKERFEDFIAPFLEGMNDAEIELSTRPREGDIVYFPLGRRLFEIKFVEHEQPFYQLGKTYVYELKCELFEYEDEVLDTSIDEVDQTLQNQGYVTSLELISIGSTATASSGLSTGYVQKVYLTNDGYGYTSAPVVTISSAPSGGINASAVAITTSVGGAYSIRDIVLTNAGAGYTIAPSITISGGGGSGAAATCGIQTAYNGVRIISIGNSGTGYATPPTISISSPTTGPGIAASAFATLQGTNISKIYISNAGAGFTVAPTITISAPSIISGTGNFIFNEEVVGSRSGTIARVKSWDRDTNILEISINDGQFYPGELVVGSTSSASYSIKKHNMTALYDKYEENDEIETEADLIIDFSESNPFGNY
jgi:hypothetical protein